MSHNYYQRQETKLNYPKSGMVGQVCSGGTSGLSPVNPVGELEQIGQRLERLVNQAQSHNVQLECLCDRMLGADPNQSGGATSPSADSFIGKLNQVCNYLEANLDGIARSVERLSRL